MLAKLKAQLRAHVFEAVRQRDDGADDDGRAFSRTPEGALMTELVSEYLECLGLDYSKRVFDAESGAEELASRRDRAALARDMGVAPPRDDATPLLAALEELAGAEDEAARGAALAARVAAMSAAADASGFKDAAGETFVFRGGDIELGEAATEAPDLDLERLSGCVVFILGTVRALRCHDLTETKIYGGPVAGSAHVQNLENCHVEIAARQVRVHDARRTRFHVRTKSRPIIEHSREVTFAPFAFAYDLSLIHI
mgnify:CR=1 FL=1